MIENLIVDNAQEIAAIYNSCFDEKWNTEFFANSLSSETGFGYKFSDGIKIFGFILCRQVDTEIEVITFCVLPQFRNMGIGRKLLETLSHYSSVSNSSVFLEVDCNNQIAIGLYQKIGFQQISTRKSYYQNGADAIVMKL